MSTKHLHSQPHNVHVVDSSSSVQDDILDSQVKELKSLDTEEPEEIQRPTALSWLVCVAIFMAGIGVFLYALRDSSLKSTSDSITPTQTVTLSPTLIPSPTPAVSNINKSAVTISVLNGSGVPGLAAQAKLNLQSAGYSQITTGNADRSDYSQNTVTAKADFANTAAALVTDLASSLPLTLVSTPLPANSPSDIEIILGKP